MGRILRTIYFKNKRLEQYSWHKEGDFIVKRDMLIEGFPIILKYKIRKCRKCVFYNDLMEECEAYVEDPLNCIEHKTRESKGSE